MYRLYPEYNWAYGKTDNAPRMNTKKILQFLIALAWGLATLTGRAVNPNQSTLSFFIVGDAHVGYANKMQPSLEKQRANLRTILTAFPDLDFFIDAGDNMHPDAEDAKLERMRKDWMSLEPNGCLGIPFLYAAGNHEVMHFRDDDPEVACAVLGSAPCRPYYSITRKGIHLISFPELSSPVFLSGELLDWLRLDLAAHREQTTLIISHNSILGTTGNDAPGYRGLVQSEALLKLFEANPQVIAWFHGHNHDYAVVPRQEMLFVSVGRFGGFSFDAVPAGGILVEVAASGIRARSFNAETGQFLTGTNGNLNHLPVSGSLTRTTSLDNNAKTEVCFGLGRDQEGSKVAVFNHFTGGTASAYLVPEHTPTLNDNPDFSLYAERDMGKQGIQQHLFGYDLRPKTKTSIKAVPGALVLAWQGKGGLLMAPGHTRSTSYYQAVPGKPYQVVVDLTAPVAGTLTLNFMAASSQTAASERRSMAIEKIPLKSGRGTYTAKAIFKSSDKSIYSDAACDARTTISIEAIIGGMNAATIHSLTLSRADTPAGAEPALVIGGTRLVAKPTPTSLWTAELGSVREARRVIENVTPGISSWLIAERGVDWQVRNAAATDQEKSLVIEAIRNRWAADEIQIAPLFNTSEPFLAKTDGVHSFEFFPLNRGNPNLRVLVREAAPTASLLIKSAAKPKSVSGAVSWEYQAPIITVKAGTGANVQITF